MSELSDTGSVVRLRGGRMLGVLEVGDPAGRPIFYFHGHPGSRLEAWICDASAKRHGARIIAIDRPGYGLSDPMPGRQILDWPADVGEIADQRGVDRFAVIGVSGGGPYAAACAHALPQRVVTAALVAGVGPMDASYTDAGMIFVNRLLLRTSRALPIIPTLVFVAMARLLDRYPDALIARALKLLPPSDQELLADPEIRAMVVAAGRESFRQGARHVVRDTELYAMPWGFDLSKIEGEVHVFQGERDVQVPPVMGHYQAETIPGAIAHFYEEDGHFALAIGRIDDILDAMMNSNGWTESRG